MKARAFLLAFLVMSMAGILTGCLRPPLPPPPVLPPPAERDATLSLNKGGVTYADSSGSAIVPFFVTGHGDRIHVEIRYESSAVVLAGAWASCPHPEAENCWILAELDLSSPGRIVAVFSTSQRTSRAEWDLVAEFHFMATNNAFLEIREAAVFHGSQGVNVLVAIGTKIIVP